MIISSDKIWLILAALTCSVSVYFPVIGYFSHLIALFFSAKAFANRSNTTSLGIQWGELISFGFLAFFLMIIYNSGFNFLLNSPYTVSLGRFIFIGLILIAYSLFGAMLITALVCMLILLSQSKLSLHWSFKEAFRLLKQDKALMISGFLPLGIFLFSAYNVQELFYYFSQSLIASLLYFFVYCSLFLASFYWAESTFVKLQIPLFETQARQENELSRKKQKSSATIAYAIALFSLIFSPLITVIFYFNGIVYGVNYHIYILMLWSWFLWLILSIYFVLIRQTQSTLTLLMVFLPLCIAIVCLLTLSS